MKLKQFKDMGGNTYYRTEDRKYLVMKSYGTWAILKMTEDIEFRVNIYDGFTVIWDGMKKLKDAKGFVEEQYI